MRVPRHPQTMSCLPATSPWSLSTYLLRLTDPDVSFSGECGYFYGYLIDSCRFTQYFIPSPAWGVSQHQPFRSSGLGTPLWKTSFAATGSFFQIELRGFKANPSTPVNCYSIDAPPSLRYTTYNHVCTASFQSSSAAEDCG
jgi:hypothetical protein